MNQNIAVFPGSFDPITKGHEDIILRAAPLFTKIIVAIGVNSQKNYMFSLDQRMRWLEQIFREEKNVSVEAYEGLTVSFCKSRNAKYILRGIRNTADYEFEKNIAQMNNELESSIETIFFVSKPGLSAINSTIIRDILRNKGDVSAFIPKGIDIHEK
jgi:pantetheine-phosphate adenylyltransferase